MQNNTWVEWRLGFLTTREVTWREFCRSVWQNPAQHFPSPQPEPLWAQLLLGRQSWEAGESLPSSNACFHNLHFKECPFNIPAIDQLIRVQMECGFHIWKHAGVKLFLKCVYVWGTLHAGYLLSDMLNSALQRQSCKRQCGGGGEESEKMEKLQTTFLLEHWNWIFKIWRAFHI